MLSGTAAAGLPLVGTVTVKDALGATKTVTLNSGGGYTIDVGGMTSPLVLRAEGDVGGTRYVIHSAITTVGNGATVNITPLTDLIIDNAAGEIAANYFDRGSFAGLTQAEIDAESAALKAKLLPVLQAMKVDASIDLLRTPFTPLASALDAALDILRVSVDPATNVATITNLVNQISIADNITVPSTEEGNPPPLSGDGTAPAADDLPLIRKALTDFSDLYKNGLPSPASILPMLSASFINDDENRVDFSNEIANETDFIGASFTDMVVKRLDYGFNGGATPLAIVDFSIIDKNGAPLDGAKDFALLREADGHWAAAWRPARDRGGWWSKPGEQPDEWLPGERRRVRHQGPRHQQQRKHRLRGGVRTGAAGQWPGPPAQYAGGQLEPAQHQQSVLVPDDGRLQPLLGRRRLV